MKSLQSIALSEIHIGKRVRSQLGDLNALAESMSRLGLLQPVVLASDYKVLGGVRRIEAARMLGWKEINAVVAGNLTEAIQHLQAERDENTCREPFTPLRRLGVFVQGGTIEELGDHGGVGLRGVRASARDRLWRAGSTRGEALGPRRKRLGSGAVIGRLGRWTTSEPP